MSKIVITTLSSTRYFVDTEAKTLVPQAGAGARMGTGWCGVGLGRVTPDGEVFHYDNDPEIVIGQSVYFENASEWRVTSTVKEILIS